MPIIDSARNKNFDGLRGWAALVVVLTHVMNLNIWWNIAASNKGVVEGEVIPQLAFYSPLHIFFSGGDAVAVFFTLSGAVLVKGFPGRTSLQASYFVSRMIRLYLPIWGALLLALLLSSIRPNDATSLLSDWHSSHLSSPVFTEIIEKPKLLLLDMFVLNGTSMLDSALWSMRVEILFSLILFLAVFFSRFSIFGFVFSLLIMECFRNTSVSWFTDFLPFFMLGGFIIRSKIRPTPLQANLLWIVGVAAFTAPYFIKIWGFDYSSTYLRLIGAGSLIFAATGFSLLNTSLHSKFSQYLGSRSYSLYLIHTPVIVWGALWILQFNPERSFWWFWSLFLVILSLGVAEIFFRSIEKPSHLISQTLRKKLTHPKIRLSN